MKEFEVLENGTQESDRPLRDLCPKLMCPIPQLSAQISLEWSGISPSPKRVCQNIM